MKTPSSSPTGLRPKSPDKEDLLISCGKAPYKIVCVLFVYTIGYKT